MAKKAVEKKPAERPGKGVAVRTKPGLPSTDLQKMMSADAGKGISAAPEDNLVPIAVILQDNTPEAQKQHARYQKGAEGGMIWLKNASEPFVPGEDGIQVQHCHSYKAIVEWKPRDSGGGFIMQHPWGKDIKKIVPDAKEVPDPKDPKKTKWVRKNNNELIDTRYEVVRVFREDGSRLQYVIPFVSSGHTVAKGWNTLRGTFHLADGNQAPSFSRLYRMKTKSKTNAKGTWFLFDISDEGWIDDVEEYQSGLALFNAFNKGEKHVDTATMGNEARGGEDEEGI